MSIASEFYRKWEVPNKLAHFVTYFGEIYYGFPFFFPHYPDLFFIVQASKTNEMRALTPEEQTLEKLQTLGREIRDLDVIKDVRLDQPGKNIPFKDLITHGEKFKRMFVFGAAASTYCVFGDKDSAFRDAPLNPPTGIELFEEKYDAFIQHYPGAKNSISTFASKGYDIETCLQEEWNIYKSTYNRQLALRHINIQYYLRHLFQDISKEVVDKHWRNNLYSLFLDKLQKHLSFNKEERITLTTFNYDTILDQFVEQVFGQKFAYMGDYIDWAQNQVLLIKPHGSANWGWPLKEELLKRKPGETTANALYRQKAEPWQIYYNLIGDYSETIATNSWGAESFNDVHRRGRFTLNKQLIERLDETEDLPSFPALLVPYRDKDEFVMPYDHARALRNTMGEMEELYLIGWKGSEDLFNRKLKEQVGKLKKIVIVNPDAEAVKESLAPYLDLSKYQIECVYDFETFVLEKMDGYLGNS